MRHQEERNSARVLLAMGTAFTDTQEGLLCLKALNAQGCCLVGHPDYYKKLGFANVPGLMHEGVPQEVFLALSFDGRIPHGLVTFHEGFKADGQQEGAGAA